jgi:hypothetical protein
MRHAKELPLGILAALLILATLGFAMKEQEPFQTLQDKFVREVRFVPKGDQWRMDRRRGMGM